MANDWLQYQNQNATRNQPLSPRLVGALNFLPEMGVTMRVYSGGQDAIGQGDRRTGSVRHDHGEAADADFYIGDRKLDWNNQADIPVLQNIVRAARSRGVTGFGAGDDYMGAGRMHIGFGPEAVWGAGGSSANAPSWLRDAVAGSELGAGHSMGDGHNHGGGGTDQLTGQQANDVLSVTPQQTTGAYQAYINGQMSPEDAAAYQADVAAGRMPLPTGVTMPTPQATAQTPAAPQLPDIAANADVVAEVYRRYVNGELSTEAAQEYARDVQAGRMGLPPDIPQLSGDPMTPSGFDAPAAPPQPDTRFAPDLTRQYAAESGGDLAMQAAAGLTGSGPSPTGAIFPNAPGVLRGAGDAGLAVLGTLGAAGGAIAGAVGDVAEMAGVPRAPQLARDLAAMPEALAGSPVAMAANATRIPSRAAPRVSQAVERAPDLAAAERAGVRVLTSDVRPPESFAARSAQALGERIPFAGTGPVRATQANERANAVRSVVREFADPEMPIDTVLANVTSDLLAVRQQRISGYVDQKAEVINRLAGSGVVDTTATVAAIDNQISEIGRLGLAEMAPVISRLENWRDAVQGKDLADVERIRRQMGESFTSITDASVRSAAEASLSSIYGPLRSDMGEFIQANGERRDYNKWMVANRRLSDEMQQLGVASVRGVLNTGAETPENVRRLLFSQKTSDIGRLYSGLSADGRSNARAAVMLEAMNRSGGIDDISPARFVTEMTKLGRQVGIVFREQDREVVNGLVRTLKLTSQADRAGLTPPTGVQNFFASALGGASLFNQTAAGAAGAATTIGLSARAYESGPMRNLLMRLSRAESGSDAERTIMNQISELASSPDAWMIETTQRLASQAPDGETAGNQQ